MDGTTTDDDFLADVDDMLLAAVYEVYARRAITIQCNGGHGRFRKDVQIRPLSVGEEVSLGRIAALASRRPSTGDHAQRVKKADVLKYESAETYRTAVRRLRTSPLQGSTGFLAKPVVSAQALMKSSSIGSLKSLNDVRTGPEVP